MGDDIVQSLWDEHKAWSAVADTLRRRRAFWRTAALVCTVSGAALQTLAAALGKPKSPVGAAGAVSLAFVPFMTARLLTPERTRSWLRSRSVSEAIKSEVYTFRASADPYAGADALEALRKRVAEILTWGEGLALERAKADAKPSPAPGPMEATGYLKARVDQQIENYYRPKARHNAKRAGQFQWAETLLAAAAALLGAYASFSESAAWGQWVAVLTTVAGSISAHAAAGRYDFQATTFFATAKQLQDLANGWRASGKAAPSPEWSGFVHDCEGVISAENRGWMAKLDQNQR